MAKNQHSQNPSGEYVEIYIASAQSLMSSAPALAPPQTFAVPASKLHAFRLKAAAPQLPSSGEVIPVEIDPQLLSKVQKLNKKTTISSDIFLKSTGELTKVSSNIKQEAAQNYVPVQHQKKTRTQETMNDKFTAYINRVKHGMLRTLSNVESAEISTSGDEKPNDVWINHNSSTQVTIDMLPSIVAGNNVTFK